MSDGERHYAPTAERLAALREQGIFPYSPAATRCFAAATALLTIVLCRTPFAEKLNAIMEGWRSSNLENFATSLNPNILRDLLLFLSLPALAGAAGALVCGFAQTRLWFSFARISPNFGRLFSLERISPGAQLKGILSVFLLTIFAAWFGAAAWYLIAGDLMLLVRGGDQAGDWMVQAFIGSAPYVIFTLVAASLVMVLMARYLFARTQQMSRREVESEARER